MLDQSEEEVVREVEWLEELMEIGHDSISDDDGTINIWLTETREAAKSPLVPAA